MLLRAHSMRRVPFSARARSLTSYFIVPPFHAKGQGSFPPLALTLIRASGWSHPDPRPPIPVLSSAESNRLFLARPLKKVQMQGGARRAE